MRKGIKVKCDQQKIFDFVTDYRSVNYLLDEFVHFEPEFQGAIQTGLRYRATGGFAGIKFCIPFVVTAYEPAKLMVLQSHRQLECQVRWEIQSVNEGMNLLILEVDLDLSLSKSSVFGPLLSLASWISEPIKAQIRHKQTALIREALLRARSSLEVAAQTPVRLARPQLRSL